MTIAITPGEPAGVGPELILQLAQKRDCRDWVVVADPDLMAQRAQQLGLTKIDLVQWQPGSTRLPGQLAILPETLATPSIPGKLDSKNGPYVLKTLDRAIDGCLQGEFAAMVTCPIQKSTINDSGTPFSGHTEYLQQRCNRPQVVMMLATPGLRVALVTTHLPLRQIPDAITPELLEQVIQITHQSLQQQFGINKPKLLVCGLNPHAGEAGHLGREEIEVIDPTLDKLRQQGLDLEGCLPADTLFTPKYLDRKDAVIAMYHDQGLPVLKHLGFGNAVNITLGLPIVRTSVDHGTALDLAGTGKADCGSLDYAINTALTMSNHQTNP